MRWYKLIFKKVKLNKIISCFCVDEMTRTRGKHLEEYHLGSVPTKTT